MMDYKSAEEVYAELEASSFSCEQAFFPSGRSEPTGYSTATCQHGPTTVHIGVNQERGDWIGSNYESHDPGEEAMVKGNNWSVSFEAPIERSIRLAREVQGVVGGEIVHASAQED